MYVLLHTFYFFTFITMEEIKNKNSPRKEEYLKLNHRAWEYITMLDDDDAWKLIKFMLSETVWIKNEKLADYVFEEWETPLNMAAMMWNEHLFDN